MAYLYYYFSEADDKKQPYIFCSESQNNSPELVIQFPEIFLTPMEGSVQQDFFSIENAADTPLVKYRLKINKAVYTFTEEPVRQNILSDFTKFLIAVEQKGLIPGTIELIRKAVASILPMTFQEVLYYHYGLNYSKEYCYFDLTPSIRLRIDFQTNQLSHAPFTDEQQYLNGFVGCGSSYIHINNYFDTQLNAYVTGFDPFLNLVQNTIVGTGESPLGGGGGIIDFKRPLYRKKYFRVLYPGTFPPAFSNGTIGIGGNVAFIGADSLADIENATSYYIANQTLDGLASPAVYFYFRGRASVVPEIAVFMSGDANTVTPANPVYITLGTTFRQLLSRFTVVPRTTDRRYVFMTFKFYRNMVVPIRYTTTPYQKISLHNVVQFYLVDEKNVNYTPAYNNYLDVFDMPMVNGDEFTYESDFYK